ncbi:uncharacterized protein LOC124276572 [Haliotis rubra]|uniref:uncharacterized protein LOC124276572 n=1 Tax=Haliotis rubra TaxID=36100 RepID=UPI001EE50CC2|nr:uncharacterized protein LOC124276572 [Haliotis rubra]
MKLQTQRYNSAVSKEVTKNVRKFTTVTFNSIYGLVHEKELMKKESFELSLARIEKERSRLCIPDSLSMNNEKYKHVVRAFLSSVAATEFVSDENDETLWFLTHKQFRILTGNIDFTDVHVHAVPARGGRVLSLTVCQRLQKLGRTLLISDDDKLIERARNHKIVCKTFSDLGQEDLAAEGNGFLCLVIYEGGEHCSSQVPHLPQLLAAAQRRWVFHRHKENLTKLPDEMVDTRGLYQRRTPCMQIEKSLPDIEAVLLQEGSLEVEYVQQTYHDVTLSKTMLNIGCHKEEDVQQRKRLSLITRPDYEVKRKRQVEQVVLLTTAGGTF